MADFTQLNNHRIATLERLSQEVQKESELCDKWLESKSAGDFEKWQSQKNNVKAVLEEHQKARQAMILAGYLK
jgi:hypothetical protein